MELPADHEAKLRLRLTRAGDRMAQTLELDRRGCCQLLAVSVEGATADRWPPSPPLIDVFPDVSAAHALGHAQALGPTRLLATGAAGTSFWSLAITRTADAIVFEHACRLHESAEGFLGSTYELPGPVVLCNDRSASLPTAVGDVQVQIQHVDDQASALQLVGSRLTVSAAQRFPHRALAVSVFASWPRPL